LTRFLSRRRRKPPFFFPLFQVLIFSSSSPGCSLSSSPSVKSWRLFFFGVGDFDDSRGAFLSLRRLPPYNSNFPLPPPPLVFVALSFAVQKYFLPLLRSQRGAHRATSVALFSLQKEVFGVPFPLKNLAHPGCECAG